MEFDSSVLSQCPHTAKIATEVDHTRQFTLHCLQCNTILGDSVSVCGELTCMDSIICLRVTNDVVVSDSMESGRKGEMAKCIYSTLKCGGCGSAVGKVIHSAPLHLAMVRSMFLLYKANISCYILNHSSVVKASTLSFDLKPLKGTMNEVKQQFEAQLEEILRNKSRLVDSKLIK